jgi:hypothetical protein
MKEDPRIARVSPATLLYYVHPHPKDSQRQLHFVPARFLRRMSALLISVKRVHNPPLTMQMQLKDLGGEATKIIGIR